MNKKSIRERIPMDLFEQARNMNKSSEIPSRMDCFRIINGMLPKQILQIKKIRKPKSKEVFLQIDTRQVLKL